MRIHFENDAVPRASGKRLMAMLDAGEDAGYIGPLKLGQAQRITAIVLGYASWQELRKCLSTERPSALDDELDARALNARHSEQAARLAEACSVPLAFAEQFIGIWLPSLGPAAYNDWREDEGEDGEDEDFVGLDEFRLMHPSDLGFGVDLCQGLGWQILSVGKDDEGLGMPSILVRGRERNMPIPIFVSALAFIPGDDEDAQAMQQRRKVSQFIDSLPGSMPGTCIVYQVPMGSNGFLFAGAVYRNRKWHDMPWSFALTSVDVLFEWADRGWDMDARNPETADKDGRMQSLVMRCMESSHSRMMGMR